MAGPSKLSQKNRIAGIETPLGPDVLVLKTFSGTEPLGRLFHYEAELLSEDHNLAFEDLIGESVTVRLRLGNGENRYFNGVVSRFVHKPTEAGDYAHYEATIVPWLWFLTRTSDCRIFQDMSVPDIVEEVMKLQGFDQVERRLSGTDYAPWVYCVQYRETDFNFISRLLEQEGIYYYFRHEEGKHTLVLADSAGAHDLYPGYEEVTFLQESDGGTDAEHIRSWVVSKELLSGACASDDYNFEKPKVDLKARSDITREHAQAAFEVYDYPGEYDTPEDADAYTKIRIEELQSRHEVAKGTTDARGLCTGFLMEVKDLPREDQNRKCLIVSSSHSIRSDAGESSGGQSGGSEDYYRCAFQCIDEAVPYRSARITPKPVVQGPQTAFVVGPKGEEIYTDKFGRVKVQFHWDRYGNADENSSCWIRISQGWAGKQWGAIFLPRIGQEVIVEFLEGDPDQPIITGRVYNAEAMPPYDLPANATMSTIKSNSSKGGGGCNEIRFEDKKGEEQLFIHGQRNMDIRSGNDRFDTTTNDFHLKVGNNTMMSVGANMNLTSGGDFKGSAGKDLHLKSGGLASIGVGGSLSLQVKSASSEKVGADHSHSVGGQYSLKASSVSIKADKISLQAGGSQIVMTGGNILIKTGGEIEINGSSIKVTASGALEESGATVKVNGSGGVEVTGATVKLNS